jgi:hypothetical protein
MEAMGLSVRAGTPSDALAELNDQRSKIEALLKLLQ